MSVVFRLIALILIVAALMLLGADVVTSLQQHEIAVRSIGDIWGLINPAGLAAFKAWVEASLPGPVPGWVYALLSMWSWGVLGVLGVILAFLFGRRYSEA